MIIKPPSPILVFWCKKNTLTCNKEYKSKQPGAVCIPWEPPPRTFIAKFLNYMDRDAALRLAREKGNIPYGNLKVGIFPDFLTEVQRRHQSFMEAKQPTGKPPP